MHKFLFTLFAGLFSFGLLFNPPVLAQGQALKLKDMESLLDSQQYQELDQKIAGVQDAFERGEMTEDDVFLVFDEFNVTDPTLEAKLNRWVEASPKSYSAYLARGIYYKSLGWKNRGAKISSETAQAKIDAMKLYFDKAIKEFSAVQDIKPNLIVVYCALIDIYRNYSENNMTRLLAEEGLKYFPESLLVRWYYLLSLEPKWGGSFEEMDRFIKEAEPFYEKNPKLRILKGRIAVAKGDQFLDQTMYPQAIALYDEGLSYGDHFYYNKQRGEAYFRMQNYEKAVIDLDRSLNLRPNVLQALGSRAYGYMKLGQYDKALSDYEEVQRKDPAFVNLKQYMDFCAYYKKKLLRK
jgi:tetratricopeptide (TPR) repeat protein